MSQHAPAIPFPDFDPGVDPDYLVAAADDQEVRTPIGITAIIALFAFTVIVFSYNLMLFRVPYYLGVLSAVAAILVYFQYSFPIPVPVLFFLSWFCWSCITAFATESREVSMQALTTVGQILIMFVVFATTCQDRRTFWVVGIAFVLGAVANAVAALAFGIHVRDERAAGLSVNPNIAANVYGVAICILLAGIPALRGGFMRLICLGLIGAFLFAVVGTGSRAGALTVVAAVLYFLFFYRRQIMAKPILVALLVGIFIASGIVLPAKLAKTELGKRSMAAVETLTGEALKSESSTTSRINLKFKAIRISLEHPILGVGIGCFTPYMFRYEGETLSTHDTFLDVLSGTGFPGFFMYYAIYVWLWVTAGRLRRTNVLTSGELSLVAMTQTFLVFRAAWDFFENTGWNTKPPWIIMAVLAGVLTGTKIRVGQRIQMLRSYGVI